MHATMNATTWAELLPLMPMAPREWDRVKIGHNTTAERYNRGGGITVRLHGNEIVRLADAQSFAFTLAGWNTSTTSGRINTFLRANFGERVKVRSVKGSPWLIDHRSGREVRTLIDPTEWVRV